MRYISSCIIIIIIFIIIIIIIIIPYLNCIVKYYRNIDIYNIIRTLYSIAMY